MQNNAAPPDPKTLDAVKAFCVGTWESLSVELRPTEDRAGTGVIEPTRLTRRFEYHSPERFTGAITMFMDDYGAAPLMRFTFRGHLKWGGEHPIADGAWCIDYVLDQGFDVDPLHEGAVQMLNAGLPEGMDPFAVDKTSSILGKPFPLFGIEAGQTLVDHDLLYFRNGLLFMGAKHVDGTPFDRPERRPHQLQIPLARA